MPYIPPTLQQCVEKARQDFQANLPGSNAWLFPNNVAVSAKVMGGLIWSGFRFLTWISKQILVTTCSRDYLYMHGAELGVTPKVATPSSGGIQVTGTVTLLIPTGTLFQRQDGLQILSTADAVIPPGGVVTVQGQTTVNGAMTNTIAGTPLTCALAGVTSATSLGVVGGSDAESVEAYRQRVLYKKRNPPHVGSPSDYIQWATAYPGVTRAWVSRAQFGPGTVGIYFMMDTTYSNGIPTGADVNNLANYLSALAPADASLTVLAPTALPVTITIASLRPYTASVRQAITDELTGMFQRRASVDPLHPLIFYRSWIDEAVSRATGEDAHDLNVPAADITVPAMSIAILGPVVYAP